MNPIFTPALIRLRLFSYSIIFISSLIVVSYFAFLLQRTMLQPILTTDVMLTLASACQKALTQSKITTRSVVLLSLLATMALLCVKTCFSILKSHQVLRRQQKDAVPAPTNKLLKLCRKYGISQREVLLVSDSSKKRPLTIHLPAAMTMGALSPKIILSTSIVKKLTNKQLEAVFIHELYHLKQRHPLFLLLGALVSKSLVFFPILSQIYQDMKHQFEAEADESVVTIQGTNKYLMEAAHTFNRVALDTSQVEGTAMFGNYANGKVKRCHKNPVSLTALVKNGILSLGSLLLMASLANPVGAQVILTNPPTVVPISQMQDTNNMSANCNFLGCMSLCVQETVSAISPNISSVRLYSPKQQ